MEIETFTQDLMALLQYLLPGFVAAWIFYNLTSYSKPSQFERVIQALIFTLFIQVIVLIIEMLLILIGKSWTIGMWDHSATITWSIIVAVALGTSTANFANNDKIHKVLRGLGITRETSFPSEWFGAFLNDVTYIVLHLKDERRLYGWPIEWPSEPTKGHFVIADPSWIDGPDGEQKIQGVTNILIDVNEVKWVEFMESTWEKQDEQKGIESASTEAGH